MARTEYYFFNTYGYIPQNEWLGITSEQQEEIDEIKSVIPSAASETNQLTDKNYVDTLIATKADKIHAETTMPQNGFLPNTLYNLGTISDNTTFGLDVANLDSNVANVWTWTFDVGETVPTITWDLPSGYLWADGEAPSLEQNTRYEISILNALVCVVSAEITA